MLVSQIILELGNSAVPSPCSCGLPQVQAAMAGPSVWSCMSWCYAGDMTWGVLWLVGRNQYGCEYPTLGAC